MYSIINKKAEVEGKSKKIFRLDDNTYFMVFKPHLRSITSKREENIQGTENKSKYVFYEFARITWNRNTNQT